MNAQSRRFVLAIITLLTLSFTIASLGMTRANPFSAPCLQAPTFEPRVPTNTPSGIQSAPAPTATSTSPCQTPTSTPSTVSAQKYSGLIAQASKTGKLRVIVGLNMSIQLEGVLNKLQIAAQRTQIQSAKNVLLNMLAPFGIKNPTANWQIPYMAMEVSPAALKYMSVLPQIKSIREDRRYKILDTNSNTMIHSNQAWAAGYDGGGTTPYSVAVLDTGVQSDHPFLAGKVIAEACFSYTGPVTDGSAVIGTSQTVCPNGQNPSGQDVQYGSGAATPCSLADCAHGTHVAGIVAGVGGGATGIEDTASGVAKGAKIVAVQVFSKLYIPGIHDCDPGPCLSTFDSDVISGLNYVYENRATFNLAAVNLSLGGGGYDDQAACDQDNAEYKSIIDQLRSMGIATVIASGNEGYNYNVSAPACVSSAIAVGASDLNDQLADFSNSNDMVDLLAPGEGKYTFPTPTPPTPTPGIKSSVPSWADTDGTPDGYTLMRGTSMAAPHVAGAWAILRQRYPTATFLEILARLQNTGVGITNLRPGVTNNVRAPRIQIDDALMLSACDNGLPHLIRGDTGYQAGLGLFYDARPEIISADGRYVIFEWNATTLDGAAGRRLTFDTNNSSDIIFHDRLTCQTMRISMSYANGQPNGGSSSPSASSDGRYIAFTSGGTNLVPNLGNSSSQIYVFDRTTMQNSAVSVNSTGALGTAQSLNPSISADGRYIVFESDANNLVTGTNVVHRDIFLRDRTTNQTSLVTHVGAVYSNGWSGNPVISANGNVIAFQSQATAFATNDTNGTTDIFIYNRTTNTMSMVSRSSTGGSGNKASTNAAISGDGHFVVFESTASNLVDGDTNGKSDIFIRDTWGGVTFPISVANYTTSTWGNGDSFNASISASGDYIMFESDASNLVAGDTNSKRDVFIRKISTNQTIRVSLSSSNSELTADSKFGFIAPSTNNFVFRSSASNVVAGDTNVVDDLFVGSYTFPPTPTRLPTNTKIPRATQPPLILTNTPYPTYTPSMTPTITPTPTNVYVIGNGPLP